MVSDKQLVKQLQKEVARLEAELRTPEPSKISCSEELLMEKELQIKKVYNQNVSPLLKYGSIKVKESLHYLLVHLMIL